ncbi:MAG: LPS assembly lipoprotein LptE [Pseudomonadota bacterium]|nr:LPS assembly lipoprotein LptE [Pseudomonadota bacterium]
MSWHGKPLILLLMLVLSGCGFSPLYAPDTQQAVSFDHIAIAAIADRDGQILRNALIDRMYVNESPVSPTHVLTVTLTGHLVDMGIRKDATATRAQLKLEADFALALVESGESILSGHERVISGTNILDSEFGTLVAERNARDRALVVLADRITNRLALYLSNE